MVNLWYNIQKYRKRKIMLLKDFGITTKIINALEKKGIYTTTDIARVFPRKYLDYREVYSIMDSVGKDCAVTGYVQSISKKTVNNRTMFVADALDPESGQLFTVRWFGMSYLWESIQKLPFKEVVFCGKTVYDKRFGYSINNPFSFKIKEYYKGKIIPIYPKMKGISEENLKKMIANALKLETEPLPEPVVSASKLMRYEEALRVLHHPTSFEELEDAKKRIIFNDMLYFCIRLKSNASSGNNESTFTIKTLEKTKQFLSERPFSLTEDQNHTLEQIWEHMKNGTRANALVQGDVGCGKTMIAFSSMFAMAENGYQSCIMAPTEILASQHYNELLQYAVGYGFKVAYLSKELKGKAKKEVLKEIESGNIDFIVGTHSVISSAVKYHHLGLVVTDEEHRFGVEQRNLLEQKADIGAHVISMSATPIPRTIADVLYGENKELYTIKTLPNGRKPVQTAINNSEKVIFEFLKKHIKTGRQAYIVCPLIEENEEMVELHSVEKTLQAYKDYFEPLGIRVAMVNGKMKKEESNEIILDYKSHKYDILISTTVIEVGVNVPNANIIVINNAERFGLAQLHQLRGRVGRGDYQSYCILRSFEKENPRLKVMERTTDGFEIANEDLKLRGIGDLIGTKQSGMNHYAELIIGMPNLYMAVKKYANWLIDIDQTDKLILAYEEKNIEETEKKTA